jgi:subtilisin
MEHRIPPDLVRGPSADFLPLAAEANWGVAAFHVQQLRDLYDGSDVIVGVVDTGVDDDHPLLHDRILYAEDFTGSGRGYSDVNGHGTHVSGTVGAANGLIGISRAKLIHCKGLGDNGSGSSDALIRAMDKAIKKGAEILSCSWGSPGEDPNITAFLRDAASAGVWPIFAAGNAGGDTANTDWPGRSEFAINTAAVGSDLQPASFTSAGAKIDTAFAGVNIWSCQPGGGFQQMSGTSMATPGNAGVLACFRHGLKKLRKSVPTVAALRMLLQSESMDVGTPGRDRRTGPGTITPILLALDLTPNPPPLAH